ncbi:hypothetical protein ccbrp13_30940 [Ktedonobacteria bacterium brp13]|nr:hypothetical protein ccbrp13_30940 [Ktedonobacteria bacterium brp13]
MMIIDAQPEQPSSTFTRDSEQTEPVQQVVEQEPRSRGVSVQEPFSHTERQDHIFWLLLLTILYLAILGSLKLIPHFLLLPAH